jgi:hypothetical protein
VNDPVEQDERSNWTNPAKTHAGQAVFGRLLREVATTALFLCAVSGEIPHSLRSWGKLSRPTSECFGGIVVVDPKNWTVV